MQDLSLPLEDSYQRHPAFHFDASSWVLPSGQLDAFNTTYSAARQIGPALSDEGRDTLHLESSRLMDEVFASLQTQCVDKHERQFVAELAHECKRLLQEELGWFARPMKQGSLDLASEHARSAAIRMQSERHFFGQLPADTVQELQRLAAKDVDRFRASAAAGKLKREELSVSAGTTVRAIRNVLNRAFSSMGVLDAVSAYTGRKTQVYGLALELSVPQATWWRNAIEGLQRPPHTLYAHLDETLSCPKAIVYLTDVTAVNGPTGCYPGAYEAMRLNPLQEMVGRVIGSVGTRPDSPLRTHYAKQYHQSMNSENFRRHFMRLPTAMRFNSHLGWDVMPDSEAETRMNSVERKMTGPAGTFIAFDGARLLHRGGLMETGERVALQVIFSDVSLAERVISKAKRMFS